MDSFTQFFSDVNPHLFALNFLIMLGLWMFGFLYGKYKRKERYEKKIRELEVDKEYWRIRFHKNIRGEPE